MTTASRRLTFPCSPALPRPAGLRLLRVGGFMLAVIVGAMVLLPLLYLLVRGLAPAAAANTWADGRTWRVVGQSIGLMAGVMAGAGVIGLPFAWLTARTDLPFRRAWLIAGLLPMVIPTYLSAITYIAAFGPRGMLYDLIGGALGVTRLPPIYGYVGAAFTLIFATYPLVVLPVRAALLKTTPILEEAAADLGANRWRAFWRVTWPHTVAPLLSGLLFAGLYSLSDFGAAAMMRYDNFTRAIYLQYANSFDRHQSAAWALILVLITVLLLAAEVTVSRRAAGDRLNLHTVTGTPHPPPPIPLGRWRVPALLFCGGVVMLGVGVPLLVIASWLVGKTPGRELSVITPVWTLAANTVGVSAITTGLAVLLAVALAFGGRGKGVRWLLRLPYLGYALPGIVIGLALVFFTTRYALPVYQTLPVLIIAYLIRFLPLALSATRHAFGQVSPRVLEAAHALGASPTQTATRIVLPLSRAGVLGGAAVVYLGVMKELPITLMLAPTGFYTLPYRVWSSYQEAIFSGMGWPALLLLLTAPPGLAFILRGEHGTGEN